MQSIQNLGLALMSMAAGSILDLRGYLFLEVFFIACLCCEERLTPISFPSALSALTTFSDSPSLSTSRTSGHHRWDVPQPSVDDHLKPLSPFGLCNRSLSRLGVQMPDHCCPHLSSLAYRSVLK
ncbi:hypothetical protein cypCar_00012709 [Cyprinus carpio]|nr:hypothetical protein cypCar_00012709 [Cyprinus carpio]